MSSYLPWEIAGRYLESRDRDAVGPCRMLGGLPGVRSTLGICFGAPAWLDDDPFRWELHGNCALACELRYEGV